MRCIEKSVMCHLVNFKKYIGSKVCIKG